MTKSEKKKQATHAIDLKIADATDDELKAILEVRKKYTQSQKLIYRDIS